MEKSFADSVCFIIHLTINMFLEYELMENELIWMHDRNSPVDFIVIVRLLLANVAYHYLLTVKFSGEFFGIFTGQFYGPNITAPVVSQSSTWLFLYACEKKKKKKKPVQDLVVCLMSL